MSEPGNNELEELGAGEIVENFARRYLENLQELPPEYAKIVSENFWDLL